MQVRGSCWPTIYLSLGRSEQWKTLFCESYMERLIYLKHVPLLFFKGIIGVLSNPKFPLFLCRFCFCKWAIHSIMKVCLAFFKKDIKLICFNPFFQISPWKNIYNYLFQSLLPNLTFKRCHKYMFQSHSNDFSSLFCSCCLFGEQLMRLLIEISKHNGVRKN